MAALALQLISTPQEPFSAQQESEFLRLMTTAGLSLCKEVINTLKLILKDSISPPIKRLHVLTLLHRCMLLNNHQFVRYLGVKLMKRLGIFAKHREKSHDPTRGSDLFGKVSSVSPETQNHSAQFLIRLLGFIRIWAEKYPEDEKGHPSEFVKVRDGLEKRGVCFPEAQVESQEVSHAQGDSRGEIDQMFYNFTEDDLRSVYHISEEIEDMLITPHDLSDFASFEGALTRLLSKLNTELASQALTPRTPHSRDRLTDAKQRMREPLVKLARIREEQEKRIRTEERKWTTEARKMQMNEGGSEKRRSLSGGRKLPVCEEHDAISSNAEGVAQEPLSEQSHDVSFSTICDINPDIHMLRADFDLQTREIANLRSSLRLLSEENALLKAEIAARKAECDEIRGKREITLKFSNEKKFKTVCFANSGFLVDSDFIQIRFDQRTVKNIVHLKLSIENCSRACLESLKTSLVPIVSSKLSCFFSRNDEEQCLSIGARAYVDIELTFTSYTSEIPKLLVSFSVQSCPVEYEVLLPVTVFRLFTPPHRDEEILLRRFEASTLLCFSVSDLHFPYQTAAEMLDHYPLQHCFQVITRRTEDCEVLFCYGKRYDDELILRLSFPPEAKLELKASRPQALEAAKPVVRWLVGN